MKTSINSRQARSSQGSRGKALERSINKLIKIVQSRGFHGHKNHPERTHSGKYIRGEPFDYEIFTDKFHWCFDAKECKQKRWSLKNAKPTQLNALKQCKNAGFDAFFLVYFYPNNKLVKFDIDLVLNTDKKSLTSEDGEEINLNELFD